MDTSAQLLVTPDVSSAKPRARAKASEWKRPRPRVWLMWILGLVNRWLLLKGLPVLRRIPIVRDLPFVHGYFWIRGIDLQAGDRTKLDRAVNAGTAAFLGPNHPEFGTDWLIDKEVSTFVAPRMASWADRGIVAAAPGFWGMNNLIANDGGDAAKDYSIEWAIEGEGVLLHPEGTVRWTNDVVHPLFPGIVQMAMSAAALSDKPVFIVPLVWKYRYVRDVSRRMHREMRILEDGLGLPRLERLRVPLRFHALQLNILARQMRHFNYEEPAASGDFFDRQRTFQLFLIETLEQRHSIEDSPDTDKRIARLVRAIQSRLSKSKGDATPAGVARRASLKSDLEMADEAKRLGEFAREVYGTPTLTQEQLYESLKRTRDRLLRRGWKNTIANMLPRPFGPRVVHIGVPEPILVTPVDAAQSEDYETRLLTLARTRMQEKLDEINARIASDVQRFSHKNPFAAS